MPRKKAEFTFIENDTDRKISYKKRQLGLLKKAQELSTLCNVEVVVILYSPYSDESKVFPNHGSATNTFVKYTELPMLERSKNMETREEFTNKRIKKLKKKLLKVRKENRFKEITNEMYEVLKGKFISIDIHPYDLNDLSYVIKKTLKLVREVMKTNICDEGSTSNVAQTIVGPMVHGGTSTEGQRALSFSPSSSPVFVVPLMSPPMVLGGANFERTRDPLLVPNFSPQSVPLSADILQSPSLTKSFNWNNDDLVTLLDDLSLNNINVQDLNRTNNI